MMKLNAIRTVAAIACLFACSCTKKVLSSVCMANVSSEVDNLTLMMLLTPQLPHEAKLSGDFYRHLVVTYRERTYEVTRRKQGRGACFDFNPPIPLTGEKPKGAQGRGALADRLAASLSDYWYVVVILTALLFWFLKTPPRRLADPREPLLD